MPPRRPTPTRPTPPRRTPPMRRPTPRRGAPAPAVPWPLILSGVLALVLLLAGFLVARPFLASPGRVTVVPTATRYPTATAPAPTLAATATPPDTSTPNPTLITPPITERLVIFEAFLRPACSNCQAAAQEIETLARQYAGQPVVFLEYNADASFQREVRWWAAHHGDSVTLPMVMSDGGYQVSSGYEDFPARYTEMIAAGLARAPQAALSATARREGDTLHYAVQVTNLSSIALGPANEATVWVIVYEISDTVPEGQLTRQGVRAVAATPITTALAPHAATTIAVATESLSDVVWEALHTIVLVDYRPGGAIPAYDVLQAISLAP